jgi:uncharacterized paraquat-inducible protein A
MSDRLLPCLYCQTPNDPAQTNCSHCGMPLTTVHPENKQKRKGLFIKVFWAIVLFCGAMIWYLPRNVA